MGRRRRPFDPPVLALAFLAGGCGDPASLPEPVRAPVAASPAPPASGDPLQSLADQLGDNSFRKREEAEKALETLAPRRYADLERVRENARDPETQSRLDRILSSPRVILAAAWSKAEIQGTLGLALGERWFRMEDENLTVGYQRFGIARGESGRLSITVEVERASGGVRHHALVAYVCDAEFRPWSLKARVEPGDGGDGQAAEFEGRRTEEGWEILKSLGGKTETERIPWTSTEFPDEVVLALAPLWAQAGSPGREIRYRDIYFPTLELLPQLVRHEGPGRVSFRHGGSDRPTEILTLGEDGEPREILWQNNLKLLRIPSEEGQALRDGMEELLKKEN